MLSRANVYKEQDLEDRLHEPFEPFGTKKVKKKSGHFFPSFLVLPFFTGANYGSLLAQIL